MFSYRHAFHAGNHADVLKHTILIAMARHLTEKETALMAVDTHAGAGLYRLDGDYAQTSAESSHGVYALLQGTGGSLGQASVQPGLDPLLADYLGLLSQFNPSQALKVYPGSPLILQRLLREHDKLKLFEMHPTDIKTLAGHVQQLQAGRQVAVLRADGFEGLRQFLPPPSRRALVLMDPSYEIKSDYAAVAHSVQDGLKRFAQGVYAIWYPVIPRPEAHELPRRLKTLATQAGRPWLHATLSIGKPPGIVTDEAPTGHNTRQGLTASGMFIINPPYTLKPALTRTLPELLRLLGRGKGQGTSLDSGGS